MPLYSYHCKCGHDFDEFRPVKDAGKHCRCPRCKRPADRDFQADHGRRRRKTEPYPVLSQSLGCRPDEIQENRQKLAKQGVPTEFSPDGRAVITSWQHRKQLHKLFGMVDLS